MPPKKATSATTRKTVTKKADVPAPKRKKLITSLRGMHDILPKDEQYWFRAYDAARSITKAYGYGFIQTPIMEDLSLFVRSIGKGTDVIDKEMYSFEDRDKRKIGLRPENTAGVVRAYLQHGLHTKPQPVKNWYIGPFFRHDKPQAGRFRQLHQFGAEVIGGDRTAVVDAEIISVAFNYLRDLGIPCQVKINSIGSFDDRQRYILELVEYLRSNRSRLSDISKKRITKNPLRVLDSKDEGDIEVVEDAPQIVDWLSDDAKQHFMSVLEYLDELQIPYTLTPTLVRGLDYYTDTVFELIHEDEKLRKHGSLAGGGRYDGLVEQMGSIEPTPACGFSVGLDRVVIELKRQARIEREKGKKKKKPEVKIFFAQLGEQARQRSLFLIEQLRRAGLIVRHNLAKSALKVQLELADKYDVTHTVILGQKEAQDGTIIIRDMNTGIQEIVDQSRLEQEVKKIIKGKK